jgi:hypothetical protein
MTKEDKDLLLKDLCARLPYKSQVEIIKDGTSITDKLTTATIKYLESGYWDVKPYLFPMSSMTEEQIAQLEFWAFMKEYHKITDFYYENHIDFRGLIEKGLAIDCTNLNIY